MTRTLHPCRPPPPACTPSAPPPAPPAQRWLRLQLRLQQQGRKRLWPALAAAAAGEGTGNVRRQRPQRPQLTPTGGASCAPPQTLHAEAAPADTLASAIGLSGAATAASMAALPCPMPCLLPLLASWISQPGCTAHATCCHLLQGGPQRSGELKRPPPGQLVHHPAAPRETGPVLLTPQLHNKILRARPGLHDARCLPSVRPPHHRLGPALVAAASRASRLLLLPDAASCCLATCSVLAIGGRQRGSATPKTCNRNLRHARDSQQARPISHAAIPVGAQSNTLAVRARRITPGFLHPFVPVRTSSKTFPAHQL